MSARLSPAYMNVLTPAVDDQLEETIQISGFKEYPALVTEMGGNPVRLLKRCELGPQIFDDNERTVPIRVVTRLLALAAEETRCPHFGLLLGQRRKLLALLGPIGFLVQNSQTVRVALNYLTRYMYLRGMKTIIKLQVKRSTADYSYSIGLPDMLGIEQIVDCSAASLFILMRMICGQEWLPSEVNFAHRPPADTAPYRALFRAPMRFDQEDTGLRFPAYWLEHPIHNSDPDLCPMLQAYMTQIEQQHSGDFLGQIRRVVRTMLPTGKCTSDRLAELFSMHRQTLHRRLTANGTTFKGILDEARNEIAIRNLAETNVPISQLAAMLGYRDTSSFIRAFRRWSGAAPTEWRAHHRE